MEPSTKISIIKHNFAEKTPEDKSFQHGLHINQAPVLSIFTCRQYCGRKSVFCLTPDLLELKQTKNQSGVMEEHSQMASGREPIVKVTFGYGAGSFVGANCYSLKQGMKR